MDSILEDRGPYTCPTCSEVFHKFDTFNAHVKGSCSGGSKPFCIVYKGKDENCKNAKHKRLNLTVKDYFYGFRNGTKKYKKGIVKRKFSCYSCGKVLRNNLRFMSHVRHKIENQWKENDNINDFNICNHCYRHYDSPFHLQCHLETVHSTVPAATTCRLCEVNYGDEEMFLSHMKDKHKYNEMPYICKLCSYRSSFYLDITKHFRECHENTSCLLCPFCLAIHHTTNSYLAHVIQHMKKSVRCASCRLQFFTAFDKQAHVRSDHKSVMNATDKRKLPKNIAEYSIHVKVSHHPLSTTKKNISRPLAIPNAIRSSSAPKYVNNGWQLSNRYDELLPMEYRAFVREAKVYVKLAADGRKCSATYCMECKENLGNIALNYDRHYQKEYKCRFQTCSYTSRCYQAVRHHILNMHLKPNVVTAASSASLTTRNAISPEVPTAETSSAPDRITRKLSFSSPGQPTSKANKPAIVKTEPPSPKTGKVIVNTMTPRSARKSIFSALNLVSPTGVQKPATRKRTMADIDLLLQNATTNVRPLTPSNDVTGDISGKQRRKQLKPQKLSPNQEESNSPNSKSLTSVALKTTQDQQTSVTRRKVWSPGKMEKTAVKRAKPNQTEQEPASKKSRRTQSRSTLPSMINPYLFSPNVMNQQLKKNTKETSPKKKFVVKFPSRNAKQKKVSANSEKLLTLKPSNALILQKLGAASSPIKKLSATNSAFSLVPRSSGKQQDFGSNVIFAQNNRGNLVLRPTPLPVSPTQTLEMPLPPKKIKFSEVTKSSFVVSWTPPTDCSVTEYKLIFQGAGLPTSQTLPPAQTSVRLIGLKSNTCYVVRLCSYYKSMHSVFVESYQRTLTLRENKQQDKGEKIDEVIVLDDEDDDVMVTAVISNNSVSNRPKKSSRSEELSCSVSKNVPEFSSKLPVVFAPPETQTPPERLTSAANVVGPRPVKSISPRTDATVKTLKTMINLHGTSINPDFSPIGKGSMTLSNSDKKALVTDKVKGSSKDVAATSQDRSNCDVIISDCSEAEENIKVQECTSLSANNADTKVTDPHNDVVLVEVELADKSTKKHVLTPAPPELGLGNDTRNSKNEKTTGENITTRSTSKVNSSSSDRTDIEIIDMDDTFTTTPLTEGDNETALKPFVVSLETGQISPSIKSVCFEPNLKMTTSETMSEALAKSCCDSSEKVESKNGKTGDESQQAQSAVDNSIETKAPDFTIDSVIAHSAPAHERRQEVQKNNDAIANKKSDAINESQHAQSVRDDVIETKAPEFAVDSFITPSTSVHVESQGAQENFDPKANETAALPSTTAICAKQDEDKTSAEPLDVTAECFASAFTKQPDTAKIDCTHLSDGKFLPDDANISENLNSDPSPTTVTSTDTDIFESPTNSIISPKSESSDNASYVTATDESLIGDRSPQADTKIGSGVCDNDPSNTEDKGIYATKATVILNRINVDKYIIHSPLSFDSPSSPDEADKATKVEEDTDKNQSESIKATSPSPTTDQDGTTFYAADFVSDFDLDKPHDVKTLSSTAQRPVSSNEEAKTSGDDSTLTLQDLDDLLLFLKEK
ncbi:uncharacterized protein LOC143459639 [Clavelina lepadiformis]|uniref:uncharacterized protein LOC143459639 n=1 Tax=Clavelina lepadiformis TaxID=159417 RepID=UPI004041BD52